MYRASAKYSDAPVTFPVAADLIALRVFAAHRPLRSSPRSKVAAGGIPGTRTGTMRGRGLDFAELRAYQPGDDIRDIDWRRTARHGQAWTKTFQEERGCTLRVLADLGPGMQFGTRVSFKSVVAARSAALLAWNSAAAGDRVSALVWHGAQWTESLPRARHAGVLELIRLLTTPPQADGQPPAAFADGLQQLARHLGSNDQVAIFSDFRQLDTTAENLLVQIGRCAACRLVHVHDPFEAIAPPPGLYALTDGRREIVVDFADESVRRSHVASFVAHCERLSRLATLANAQLLLLATDAPPTTVIPPQ